MRNGLREARLPARSHSQQAVGLGLCPALPASEAHAVPPAPHPVSPRANFAAAGNATPRHLGRELFESRGSPRKGGRTSPRSPCLSVLPAPGPCPHQDGPLLWRSEPGSSHPSRAGALSPALLRAHSAGCSRSRSQRHRAPPAPRRARQTRAVGGGGLATYFRVIRPMPPPAAGPEARGWAVGWAGTSGPSALPEAR